MTLEEIDLMLGYYRGEQEKLVDLQNELQEFIITLTKIRIEIERSQYQYNRLIPYCLRLDRPNRGEIKLYSNNPIIMRDWEVFSRNDHSDILMNFTTGEACILDLDDYDFEPIRFPWENPEEKTDNDA